MDGRSVCLTKWIWFCPATRASCCVTLSIGPIDPCFEHKTLIFVAPFFKHQLVPTKLPRFFRQHRQTNKKPEASVEVGIELSNGTKEFDSSCTWTMAWGTSALGWIPKGWLSHSVTVYPVNHLKKDIKLMPYQLVSRIFCVRKYPVDFWRRLGRRFWWISKALFHQDVFFNVIVLIDRYEYLNTVDRTPTTGGLASMIFLVPTWMVELQNFWVFAGRAQQVDSNNNIF